MRSLGIGFLLLAATGVFAQQPLPPYEHVVAGLSFFGGCEIVIVPIIQRTLEWTGANASYGESDVLIVAPALGGRIFAVLANGGLAEIRPDGSRTALTAPAALAGREPLAMVVDRNGAIYVLTRFDLLQDAIMAFNPDGSLRATHPLGGRYASNGSTVIDLAADQCTLFLLSGGVVRRFNVCTGTFLPDFATVPMAAYAVRVLPDGGILLSYRRSATGNDLEDFELRQYDASGAMVRAYPLNGAATALILSDGGSRAVYNNNGLDVCPHGLSTLDLRSGAVVTSPLNTYRPLSLVTYFGWTAALGSHHGATDVPVTGAIGLAILAALTLGVALRRL
jgi:hypothetical protein